MKILVLITTVFSCVNWTTQQAANDGGRIVGGTSADIKNHKHLVQLRYRGSLQCGGSLVSTRHVVTAAHCFEDDPNAVLYSIKAGSSTINGAGQIRQVTRLWMHPKYNGDTYDFDIAVVKLGNAVQGALIQPIALATQRPTAGTQVNAAGWGLTKEEGGVYPNQLRAVTVPFVARQRCSNLYDGDITARMMCAGTSGKDTCSGDSGGPLTQGGKLVGVTSWGEGCAKPGYPGVYADVVTLTPFIKSKLSL